MLRKKVGLVPLGLVALMCAGGCLPASGIERISLCEVLGHKAEYMNKQIVVEAIVVHDFHSGYLIASPKCDDKQLTGVLLNIDWRSYYASGGKNWVGLKAIVEGKLVMSDRFYQTGQARATFVLCCYEGRVRKSVRPFEQGANPVGIFSKSIRRGPGASGCSPRANC